MTCRVDASLAWCAGLGLVVDAAVGEPPDGVHPVALFGSWMHRLERSTYADRRSAGLLHAGIGIVVAMGAGAALDRAIGRRAATVVAVGVASAGRMLGREVLAVADLLDAARSSPVADPEPDGDDPLDAARTRLAGLVGRDTTELDEAGIARAAIETLAENTVDASVATLWWGAVGGAPGAWGHRALNTLDAMVGHRTARLGRFGWASARLDDAAGWIPARLTMSSLMIARPASAHRIWRTVRRDAPVHPSPNGGVVEAAFAAALDVTLGGENRYGTTVEHRGVLGDGRSPGPEDIRAAVRAARHATTVAVVAVVALVHLGRANMRRIGRAAT